MITSAMRASGRGTRRYVGGGPLYLVGLALAFVTPWLAVGLWWALAVFFLLPLNEEDG